MEDQIIQSAIEIIQPVFESSMILAGHYVKSSGRNTITGQDIQYAMKYCARNFVGKHIGTLFPEDDSEDEEEEIETVDEDDEPFIKYSGEDTLMNEVNQAVDTWDEWVPSNSIELMLKDSIDKIY